MKKAFFLLLFLSFSINTSAQISIKYLGNMGVSISGEESSVLIDAFHTEYNMDSYLFPPQSLVDSLTQELIPDIPPIKAIAATHYHRDHLDAKQVATFLEYNPDALFFGSNQSVELVYDVTSDYADQIVTISTDSFQKQTITSGDVSITGFYINHANPARHGSVQNVGYLIEIDGVNIIHLGDTNWFEEAFTELNLQKENIDIAILPFWMLLSEDSKTNLEKWIDPKYTVATHLPPVEFEGYVSSIKELDSEIKTLTSLREVITFLVN